MASSERFRIYETDRGGLSVGFSAYLTFLQCREKARLRYVVGGSGIEPTDPPAAGNRVYGKLVHVGLKARLSKLDEKDAYALALAEEDEGLPDDELGAVLEGVRADVGWFAENSNGLMDAEVLLAEDELRAAVGRHEMRGTPDLVVRLPESWGGRPALLDWKTVDPWRGLNDARAYDRARMSVQITFYLALLRTARPELATLDAQHVLIPRQAVATIRRCGEKGFKGKTKVEDIRPKFIGISRTKEQLDEIMEEFDEAMDVMEQWRAREGGDSIAWPKNPSACVQPWGLCEYAKICHASPEMREVVMEELFKARGREAEEVGE